MNSSEEKPADLPLVHPLNLILEGPSGTGKTYQAIYQALSILENKPLDELIKEDRAQLRQRFDEYVGSGQAAFLSFHDGFSYDDFIEGVKPRMTPEGELTYVLEDGLFKLLCNDARAAFWETLLNMYTEPATQLQFNQVYAGFLKYLKSEDFQFFETEDNRRFFLQRLLPHGNLLVRPEKSFSVYTIYKKILKKLYLKTVNGTLDLDREEFQILAGSKDPGPYLAILQALKLFETNFEVEQSDEKNWLSDVEATPEPAELPKTIQPAVMQCKRFVLIIDEINRANVPAVFGETLTLLDEDKREIAGAEALTLVLSHSKTYFSVPPNIYLIGTMSTDSEAGRSQWDAVLRRRFAFKRISPDPALIGLINESSTVEGVDLSLMLQTINERIVLLLNENYTIGHAWLMNIQCLEDLKKVFETAVIPLLQVHFHGDNEKIGLVLGRSFVEQLDDAKGVLADIGTSANYYSNHSRWLLKPAKDWTAASFVSIYHKNKQ